MSSVLTKVSIFRRMPTKVIDCDPEMYLFLVRHPDVVVGVWEVLKASQLQLWQVGEDRFAIAEPAGAAGVLRYVYRTNDTHIVYAEGVYDGPLLPRPVRGRAVLVLKTGYARENRRYHITSRLDMFLSVAPIGAELLSKSVSPLIGQTTDANFLLTAAFVASLSRTAEVNNSKVQVLANRLSRVSPAVRTEFSDLAVRLAQRSAVAARPELRAER